jgi:hypothetical protein
VLKEVHLGTGLIIPVQICKRPTAGISSHKSSQKKSIEPATNPISFMES